MEASSALLTLAAVAALVALGAAIYVALLLLLPQPANEVVQLRGGSQIPFPASVNLRALLSFLKRGRCCRPRPTARGDSGLPALSISVFDATVDDDALRALSRIRGGPAGLPASDAVALLYFEVVSFRMVIALMAHQQFPFSILGSVHASTQVTQHAHVSRRDHFDFSVATAARRPHRRGSEVDFLCNVRRKADSALVWECTTTILFFHRSDHPHGSAPLTVPEHSKPVTRASLALPSDIGRRYAAICKDYNPIHLYPWAARLFGFRSHIVHGMCVAEKILPAMLAAAAGSSSPSDDLAHGCVSEARWPVHFEIAFRRPIFLPASAEAVTRASSHSPRTSWCEVQVEEGKEPSIVARVTFGAPSSAFSAPGGPK